MTAAVNDRGLASIVLDALEDAVFTVDCQQRITLWNRRIAQRTGVDASAAVGRRVFDVMPGWRTSEEAHLTSALTGTPASSSGFPLVAAGRFEATYAPLDPGTGQRGVVVTVRDVSTVELAGKRLHEIDQRFQIMADHAPVLLWMSGTDAQCTFFNQPWLTFTGRTLEMELGMGWAQSVHPDDLRRCVELYLGSFATRRPFRMEYRLRRADGQYRWLLDSGVPWFQPTGEFAGYIGSCLDITELKIARDDLDRRVRERTAELEAFSYSVSHDLRAPLRSIDGFSLALLEDYEDRLDATAQDYLRRVRDSAQHMGVLIDALLGLSQVGRADLHVERCDLSAMARTVLDGLAALEPARAVEVVIQDGITVGADPGLLRVALDNLLGNAWKFTSKVAHARIELTAIRREREVEIIVRDNGAGFDMANARRLFGAFQRLHRGEEFPGTGIGLATVSRIVTRHGGSIRAEAAPGQGACFRVTLPALAAGTGCDDGAVAPR